MHDACMFAWKGAAALGRWPFVRGSNAIALDYLDFNHFPHRDATFNPGFVFPSTQVRRVRQSRASEGRTTVQVSENPTSDRQRIIFTTC